MRSSFPDTAPVRAWRGMLGTKSTFHCKGQKQPLAWRQANHPRQEKGFWKSHDARNPRISATYLLAMMENVEDGLRERQESEHEHEQQDFTPRHIRIPCSHFEFSLKLLFNGNCHDETKAIPIECETFDWKHCL